jgi:3-phosphoshikimate 1-carboxyvinyltransferase
LAQLHQALKAKMASKFRAWGLDSIQGDIRFVEAARAMGAVVTGGPNWLQINAAHGPSRPSIWTATTSPTPP